MTSETKELSIAGNSFPPGTARIYVAEERIVRTLVYKRIYERNRQS